MPPAHLARAAYALLGAWESSNAGGFSRDSATRAAQSACA